MKILIAAGIFIPEVGGPATYISNLAKEFVKLGSNIKRMKSVYEAQNGNYLYSIKSFFKIPGLKNKLKIITAIILPKAIFNKITGR